jgi:hypothetical protein
VNEWLHTGADALVLIVVSVVGFLVHTLRDSLSHIEEKTDNNAEDIAEIKGALGLPRR